MKKLLVFLLLATPALAQTIAPRDIKPSSTNGQVTTTTGCPGACATSWQTPVTAPVTSVFGRTGTIGANTGDYTCAQIIDAVCSLGTIFYQTMQDAGADQTQRRKLNLIPGAGVALTFTDNAGADSTDVMVSASSPTATDYVWTFNSCTNSIGQPTQCIGTTTLPGPMPTALYFVHCDVFPEGASPPEPSVQFIEISTWPLPTAAGDPLTYHMVQPMQNGTHGGKSMPVVCNAHHQGSPAFAINSFYFNGGTTGELGQTFVNPDFIASYTVTPASANITNTDGISSPTVLTTPFTTGTIVGSFVHTTVAGTTFTLSATQGPTLTATATLTWGPRVFLGVGAPGATSTVTAAGNGAELSTTDVLSSFALTAETVGQVLGSVNPAGQCVYMLLIGGSHTFTDNNTGFPFAMNAPIPVSFVNQHGVTVTMYLYQSTNPLYGNYAPKVAS